MLGDAGGLTSMASLSRASLERIDPEQHQRAFDIILDAAGKVMQLRDGDIVRVLPISPSFDQTVTVRGNVADPGRFAWHPGMKLSELLPNSEALVTRDYWQKRNQLGLPSSVFQPDYAQRFTAYRQTQTESQRQYYLYLQRDQEKTLRCAAGGAECATAGRYRGRDDVKHHASASGRRERAGGNGEQLVLRDRHQRDAAAPGTDTRDRAGPADAECAEHDPAQQHHRGGIAG
jgi:hypothetical protein